MKLTLRILGLAGLISLTSAMPAVCPDCTPTSAPTCFVTVNQFPSLDADCTFYSNVVTETDTIDCSGCALWTQYVSLATPCFEMTTVPGTSTTCVATCAKSRATPVPLGRVATATSDASVRPVSKLEETTSERPESYEGAVLTVGTSTITAWESTVTTNGATYTQAQVGSVTLTQSGGPQIYSTDMLSMTNGGVVINRSTKLNFSSISQPPVTPTCFVTRPVSLGPVDQPTCTLFSNYTTTTVSADCGGFPGCAVTTVGGHGPEVQCGTKVTMPTSTVTATYCTA